MFSSLTPELIERLQLDGYSTNTPWGNTVVKVPQATIYAADKA